MSEMSMDEITILSATEDELYAYIKATTVTKDWPFEIVHNGVSYFYSCYWILPSSMRGYVQAARYVKEHP